MSLNFIESNESAKITLPNYTNTLALRDECLCLPVFGTLFMSGKSLDVLVTDHQERRSLSDIRCNITSCISGHLGRLMPREGQGPGENDNLAK